MKRKFLLACTFIFALTTGMLQASSNPTMSRVYGNQFTPQVPDTQSAATIGTLDLTFSSGGYQELNAQLGTPSAAVSIQALSDGTFLTVLQGSSVKVAKYNAEGTIQTYGTAGVATLGLIGVQASMLDVQGRLVVAGTAASGAPIQRVSADGTSVSSQFTGGTWTSVSALAQQTSGEIIAVGFNGSNGQIARYTVAGALDTVNFGTVGVVAFTVSAVATTGLYNVVVDASNNIYVAYCDSAHSGNVYVAKFGINGTFVSTTHLSYFDTTGATPSQVRMAMDLNGNLIVAAQVGNNILVSAQILTSGSFTNTTVTPVLTTLDLGALVTTSNGEILLVGNDITSATSYLQRITCLSSTGGLNTSFNPSLGYKEFSAITPTTSGSLYAAAIAVDGQIYAVGSESSGTLQPYVYRLNNYQYVSAVAQFPATTLEQGILDQTFGNPAKQTFSGVTNLYNGLYGSSMMQMANAAVEVTAGSLIPLGDILVGMNGSLNAAIPTYNPNPADSNMMFACLTSEGILDTTFNSGTTPGYLTLQNTTGANEYLNAMLQNNSGNIFLAGTSDTSGAFMRAYSSFASPGIPAQATTPVGGAGAQGVGISLQGITAPASDYRVLLCVANSTPTQGSIYAYTAGVIDPTFGAAGTPGHIATGSFGLHMGPSYGLVVSTPSALLPEAFIYAAYLDYAGSPLGVCVAKFQENGSGLIPEFGTAGVKQNIFTGNTVAANNIRIGLLENGNLVVAAVTTTGILVAFLDPVTGATTFGGSTPIAITGATSLDLTRVTGISDGTALLTFWGTTSTDKIMYVARVNASAALDTTFNSQGSQPGVLPIQIGDKVADYTARSATCALIQSTAATGYQGNIAVVGYESVTANDATPMAMRVYGAPGTTEVIDFPISITEPGTFDTAYNLTLAPDSLGLGFGKVIFNYPAGVGHDGKMLVGISNSNSTGDSIVARVSQTMALDATFGSGSGYVTLSGNNGISHVSIDKNNNILAGGSKGASRVNPVGWATLINDNGTSQTQFTMPTSPHAITSVDNIGQQESGRYIVAATEATTGNGMLIAFQDKTTSAFAVDPTFNPLGVGSATPGSFYVASTDGLSAMAINTTYNASPLCNIDTIVVAYCVSNVVNIAVVTADGGAGLSGTGYAVTPFVATGVAADSSAVVQLNIDGSQNIVVGASRNTGGTSNVYVARFNSVGGTSTHFTATGLSSPWVQTLPFTASSGVVLTGLMETTAQQTVLTGWTSANGNGPLFAARLVPDGGLDTIWNTSPVGSDYAGLLTYNSSDNSSGIAAAVNITGSAIANTGNIYSIGSTTTDRTTSDAIVTVVYGDDLVTQISQNPLEAAAGTLDNTIPGAAQTSLPLSGLVTGVPQKIYMYSPTVANGQMLIASKVDSTATVYVTMLNADLSLGTFGASGVKSFTPNSGLTPTSVTITDMYVATNNSGVIYVAGYTTTSSVNTTFVERITANGSTATAAAPVSALVATTTPSTGGIRQSSNGRVLVSGFNGSFGSVVAYNSAMTAIDTSFGNNNNSAPLYGAGYYTTSTANPIVAMTTDSSDRIYIAYKLNATTINIDRLLENGTEKDTAFNSGTVTLTGTALSATQIKLAIDLVNNQLIVAAQDITGTTSIIQLARFNLSNGGPAGSISTITLGGTSVLSLSDLFVDNDSTGSAYPNIYVIGYVSSGTGSGNSVVARVATTSSTIALDATYGSAGIANLSEGAMTVVTAAALDPDRRVYMVGSNGSTSGYMGRFFGDYYWTEASTAMLQGVAGALDLTLNPNGGGNQGAVDLSATAVTSAAWHTALGLTNGYKARAIIENPNGDGSSYIAFGNGTYVIVGQVDADMVPVSVAGGTFGTNGLTASLTMTTVNSIAVDAAGNIIVAGMYTTDTLQRVVSFTSAGAFLTAFTDSLSATVGTTVAQQKSGRYIVGGYAGSQGIVSAYQNESSSGANDLTFGPNGSNGFYPTGVNAQVDDLVIDSNDYIYIVYRNSGTVTVAKLTPEGSLSIAANTPSAQIWSTNPISTDIASATQPARIAINQAGNILVGASTSNNSGDVEVELYSGATGLVTGSPLHAMVSVDNTSTPILTKLVGSITTQNEFYGSVYNGAASLKASVFGISSAGVLDFAPTYTATESVQAVTGLSVQYDGKIVAVGYNNLGTAGAADPVLVRFYGYPYYSQFAQAPDQAAAGTLDTTLWPTSGALELNNYSPISTTINLVSSLGGSKVSRIYEYPAGGANNGKALLVFTNTNSGADTVLARVNKDLTLDTTFASGAGFVTIAGENNATALFVDSSANIYVAGGTGASWITAYNNAGTVLSGSWSAPTSYLANGAYQIGVQSVQRTILAGKATNGTLVAYNTSGVLDATFGLVGTPGLVSMGTTDAITDIAIDSLDTIITVKITSGSTVLQRVSASGLTVTSLSTANASPITTATGNAKVVLDTAGSIVVASATTAGFTIARYFNNGAGAVNGSTQLTIATGVGGGTSVLGNIYATSDGKITLVGYDTNSNKVVVARIVSSPSGVTNANMLFDVTFSASSSPQGILQTVINSAAFLALDGFICADDRIMIAGSQSSEPFLARVFGDTYVTYVSQGQTEGVAGTINPTFGTGGVLANPGSIAGAQGKAIFPISDGGFFLAFDNAIGTSHSALIKTLADGSLDTSYNITGIATSYAPLGVNSILQDGSNNMLLVGTTPTSSHGWLQRYTSAGVIDTTFNGTGVVNLASGTVVTVAVEQTLARYVIAGSNGSGAALFAYKSLAPNGIPGTVDTTFNAGAGGTPGYVQIGSTNTIWNLVADQYDRLIFAVLNSAGTAVDLYRLTPTGELDVTFGSSGKVAGAITSAAGASSVRVALDAAGNIIVAATSSTANTFSVAAYDNLVSSTTGANGGVIYAQLNISSLTHSPSVTALVTSADGYALVLGTQSGTNNAWIARITAGGLLDTGFDPAGAIHGIFQYAGGGSTSHIYDALAVNADGTLGMFGYENSGGVFTAQLVSVYDDPYTSQESQTPDSRAVGSIDPTLGVGVTSGAVTAVTDGIVYYAAASNNASYGQVAEAVALYDDNNIIVAIDGGNSTNANSSIMINMFDNDGLLNQTFGTAGTATVLQGSASPVSPNYANQYVRDMVTFKGADNVVRAILAGYTFNSALPSVNQYSSLLAQYKLIPGGSSILDPNFGGFDENPAGLAFGDGKQAFVVGQQSTGRIVVGGLSQDNLGLLLGYTAAGKLDTSFGNDGYQSVNTGSTGIYTHAIDSQNRIVFAYYAGGNTLNVARMLADGSGLDLSFNGTGLAAFVGSVSNLNTSIKVAIDSSDNVYAVAQFSTHPGDFVINSFHADGTAFSNNTVGWGDTPAITVNRMIVDAAGNVIVVASRADNTIAIIRLVNALTLDSTFNGTGYITYSVGTGVASQVAKDAMVHPDGRIIVVGSEA